MADLSGFLEAVGERPVDLLGHSMGGRVAMGLDLAASRPGALALILMDTSAWSFLPPTTTLAVPSCADWHRRRSIPPRACPPAWRAVPEEALIEARTPAHWRQEKAVLQAGTDPWAVKGLGLELFAEAVRTARRAAVHRLPDHRARG